MHPALAAPLIAVVILRAWVNNSLTPFGLLVAALTAAVHALHPWNVFFALLLVFFMGGTGVTKVHHARKALITHSSTGAAGGEGPRTHIQVLANSVVASVMIYLHYKELMEREKLAEKEKLMVQGTCWPWKGDLLVVGIVSNYAAAAADTFSSELGILSSSAPRLITSLRLRRVPPGTNGGVTLLGTAAGYLGAFTIALTSAVLLPFCAAGVQSIPGIGGILGKGKVAVTGSSIAAPGLEGGMAWGPKELGLWVLAVTFWGGLGSLLDSALGGWFQASVVDRKTGKVVEGEGGRMVPIHPTNAKKTDEPSTRTIEAGREILDNNAVNLLMTLVMSVGGMAVAGWYWGTPLEFGMDWVRKLWT